MRVGQRPVPGPRRPSGRRADRGARTGSRCPRDRTATSDPRPRRTHSRAPRRRPAPRRFPARRPAAPERRSRPAPRGRRPARRPTRRASRRPASCSACTSPGELGERHDRDLDAMQVTGPRERRQQARMLLVAGDDLVAGAKVEPGEDAVDAVGRRARQRDVRRVARRAPARSRRAAPPASSMDRRHVGPAAAPAGQLELDPLPDRLGRRQPAAGPRSRRSDTRGPLQNRELRAELDGSLNVAILRGICIRRRRRSADRQARLAAVGRQRLRRGPGAAAGAVDARRTSSAPRTRSGRSARHRPSTRARPRYTRYRDLCPAVANEITSPTASSATTPSTPPIIAFSRRRSAPRRRTLLCVPRRQDQHPRRV